MALRCSRGSARSAGLPGSAPLDIMDASGSRRPFGPAQRLGHQAAGKDGNGAELDGEATVLPSPVPEGTTTRHRRSGRHQPAPQTRDSLLARAAPPAAPPPRGFDLQACQGPAEQDLAAGLPRQKTPRRPDRRPPRSPRAEGRRIHARPIHAGSALSRRRCYCSRSSRSWMDMS